MKIFRPPVSLIEDVRYFHVVFRFQNSGVYCEKVYFFLGFAVEKKEQAKIKDKFVKILESFDYSFSEMSYQIPSISQN